jgi:PPOX class probable F420-dependent enzyme
MEDGFLPGPGTPFGERVRRRLREAPAAWLTTVGADGTPQPNPVWFIWEGGTVLVYNRPNAHRLSHVRKRPRVSLNLDSNGQGGDIVVLTGTAVLVDGMPPPHELPEYVEKYRDRMVRVSGSLEEFSRQYGVALRIGDLRVRGF